MWLIWSGEEFEAGCSWVGVVSHRLVQVWEVKGPGRDGSRKGLRVGGGLAGGASTPVLHDDGEHGMAAAALLVHSRAIGRALLLPLLKQSVRISRASWARGGERGGGEGGRGQDQQQAKQQSSSTTPISTTLVNPWLILAYLHPGLALVQHSG